MRRRRRILLVPLLAVCLASTTSSQGLPRGRPEAVGMSTERLQRIPQAMRGFVERRSVAGVVTLVARRGKIVEQDSVGYADIQAGKPMRSDTLFRIASMTKPVTSVAAMILVEEGKLLLSDPISRYLPAFREMKVAVPDPAQPAQFSLATAKRAITVRDLLTHRSGLAYGFFDSGPVGEAYRKAGVTDGISSSELTLAQNVDRIATAPLSFEPGARWQYGLSTDVLGRLVEVVSGRPFDRFVRERILQPLRMNDTVFQVPEDRAERLAVPYTPADGGKLRPMAETERFGNLMVGGKEWHGSPRYISGGAGLISTAGDYARFAQMLLNGGELDGVRLLSPKTIQLMTASATGDLPPPFGAEGTGFGLGFGVVTDVGATGKYGSEGLFEWGGLYGSTFWVDPKEQLVGVMMIQLFPQPPGVNIGDTFRTLAYQAITSTDMPRGGR
jgi:CubicO group peptidase (beta-lactamase class C family)